MSQPSIPIVYHRIVYIYRITADVLWFPTQKNYISMKNTMIIYATDMRKSILFLMFTLYRCGPLHFTTALNFYLYCVALLSSRTVCVWIFAPWPQKKSFEIRTKISIFIYLHILHFFLPSPLSLPPFLYLSYWRPKFKSTCIH